MRESVREKKLLSRKGAFLYVALPKEHETNEGAEQCS